MDSIRLSGFNHVHRNARKDNDIRKFVLHYLFVTIFGDVQALAVCSVEMRILHRNPIIAVCLPHEKKLYCKYVKAVVGRKRKCTSVRVFVIEGYKHA